MKIAIITDTHFGARSDSDIFYYHQKKFYDEVFFPYLENNTVAAVIHCGDLFEHRRYINIQTWKNAKKMFFDRIGDRMLYCIAGNHDCYFKNTNEVNSLRELLDDYMNIKIVDKQPHSIRVLGKDFHFLPWINSENYEQFMQYIEECSGAMIAHLEVEGFSMFKGMTSQSGLDPDLFKNYDIVFSGHYHTRSKKKNIQYVGAPYEMCWSDADDPRGFAVFDTETNDYFFVDNPNRIFHKIKYSKDLFQKDLSYLKNCYVKLLVEESLSTAQINRAVSYIQTHDVVECSVIDLFALESTSVIDMGEETGSLSTLELFDDFIMNNISDEDIKKVTNEAHDRGDLAKIIKDIYQQALVNDIDEDK